MQPYTVVIPVLNQLHYTQQCVQSLVDHGVPVRSLLVIDNGSTDETPAWLASRRDIPSVRNAVNLGCGGAWTQGALLAGDSAWTVLLNNDIVCGHDAIGAQIAAAERLGLGVVSPALVEEDLDYDVDAFTADFVRKMGDTLRRDTFHGVCFAVRRSVFERIGFPDTDRLLFGREDAEFRTRCLRASIPVGTTGAALLHHFGSITQKAMKQELGLEARPGFGDHRYLYAKLGLGWWGRQQAKFARKAQSARWVREEQAAHGLTLHMVHRGGTVLYR